MIRFVLRRQRVELDWRSTTLETLDVDLPELEAILTRGGYGPEGCDLTELIGAEIVRPKGGPVDDR